MPGFPLEVIAARSPSERLRADKRIIYLNGLDQFARLRDVWLCLVALKHAIQEPDNETIRQQNERAQQSRPMPKMTNLKWNQRRSRENH